jgi:hypothetical protein
MLLNDEEIVKYVASALKDTDSITGKEETKKVIDSITKDAGMKIFVNALVLEVFMSTLQKGLELSEKQRSILTMPEGMPVMVRDSKQRALVVAVPLQGKFYLAGSNTEIDIKPDYWYDINLLGATEKIEEPKVNETTSI